MAVSLANFGLNVDFVTRLPDNDIGQACLMDLRRYNVGTSRIITGGERLGIYFIETGAVARGSKVIYDRSHSSISEIKPGMLNWDEIMEGARWFHWTGITPAISEGAAEVCREAIETANRKGATVSVDLNYRKKLWKWGKKASEVMRSGNRLRYHPGNEEDADKVFGIHPDGVDVLRGNIKASAYESVCRQIKARFPRANKVVITLRGSINANHNTRGVLFDGNKFLESRNYEITHIVDRVGGGDSFMAGLIYGLIRFPGDDQFALIFAAAASCLKHTIHGDYNLFLLGR